MSPAKAAANRVLLGLALVVLALGLAACGRGDKDQAQQPSQEQTAGQPQQPPAQPTLPEAAPEPEPAPPEVAPPPPTRSVQKPRPAPRTSVPRQAETRRSRPGVENTPPEESAPTPEYRPPASAEMRRTEPEPISTPTPPRPRFAIVPAGTQLEVRLTEALSSGENQSGDTFEAVLDQDLEVDGEVVAPRGTTVTGRVTNVQRSGRVQGLAEMTLTLTGMRIGGETHSLNSTSLSFQAESSKKQDAAKVGIGAGIGAAIGAIAGGGKGAAVGAAVGAGAGTGTVLATRGKEVTLNPEDRHTFVLKSDLRLQR